VSASAAAGWTAYVSGGGTVTPVEVATGAVGIPIPVSDADAIAITPDGKTAYVTSDTSAGSVVPIDLATGTAGSPVAVGEDPDAIAITPDGMVAYVADATASGGTGAGGLTPIDLLTNTPGAHIAAPTYPMGIAITPNGETAYVTNYNYYTVTPVDLSIDTAQTPIQVGAFPIGIAVTPDGTTALVASNTSPNTSIPGRSVFPIDLATATAQAPLTVGTDPSQIAIAPDQAPTAAFTAKSGAPGAPSSFDGSGSSSALSPIARYQWSFGDGQTATTSAPTITHTYATAGTYNVSLTVTDQAGASLQQVFTGQTVSLNGGPSARISHTITIVPPPPATGSVSVTTATYGNQRLILTTPSLSACQSSTTNFAVELAAATLKTGTKLKLVSVAFYLDKGVKHTKKEKRTVKGHRETMTVTTYTANATTKRLPATERLSLTRLRPGPHTFSVKVIFHEARTTTVTRHHKKVKVKGIVALTKTLSIRLEIC
jgi:DNA-binding beta-propeller fold protein YncE